MVFHWRLSDSKSPQVSRILLSILDVFNNAVVWIISTRPPTSKSSRPFNNPLVTVPKAPITIGIIDTIFHSFFNPLATSRYLSLLLHSFSFIPLSAGTAKSTNYYYYYYYYHYYYYYCIILSLLHYIIIIIFYLKRYDCSQNIRKYKTKLTWELNKLRKVNI